MKVKCDEQQWTNQGKTVTETEKPCGRWYDDADSLTYCPHDPLGGAVCRETDLYKFMCPHCKKETENATRTQEA